MSDDLIVINTDLETKIERDERELVVFSDKHPMLRERMPELDVSQISSYEIQNIIKCMKKTMVGHNGIGLSANQCGIKLRLFTIGTQDFQTVCINPRIADKEGEPIKMREGCLSFPGLFLNIPRYQKILAEYENENGQTVSTWMEGITAQVYQHELDHMNGIVYTEHVKPLALRMAKDKQVKLIKRVKKTMGKNSGKLV